MSSESLSGLELLQLSDYVSLVLITAVVYDYFLTFSREIKYIWCRSWTWVSTIFLLVRYLGVCLALWNHIRAWPSDSVSTSVCNLPQYHYATWILSEGTVIYLVISWGFPVFYNASDLVMILRVYAMWNRSKIILGILLCIYVPQVIFSIVFTGIYDNPNTHLSVTIGQVGDFSYCNQSWINAPSQLNTYVEIPRFVLGAILLVLAVVSTLKQAIEMYKVTREWQPNRYMKLFVRDGVLYFLVNALLNITYVFQSGFTISTTSVLFLDTLSYLIISVVMPRFIISARALYDRGLRGRWQGVDTGFGVVSRSNAGQNTTVSAIVFADTAPGQDETVEGDADESHTGVEGLGEYKCQV